MTTVSLDLTSRRRITGRWLALFLCTLLAMVALLGWSDATGKLDLLLHDALVRLNQRPAPADVVIAAIDPPALAEHGRWPWPRDLQAVVITALAKLDARAVIVDIIHTEAGESRHADAALARALGLPPIVVLPVLLEGASGTAASERLPLPELLHQAAGLGHIELPIDNDGIVRRIFLKAGVRRPHWSSLALEAFDLLEPGRYRTDAGVGTAPTSTRSEGAVAPFDSEAPTRLPGLRMPTVAGETIGDGWVRDHEVLIPFFGPSGTFARFSVADLLAGRVSREAIADRVVFLGLNSTGLGDVVPTPVSAEALPLPGVEVHANLFAALREGSLITPAHPQLGLLVSVLVVPLLLFGYSRAPPHWSLVVALVCAMVPLAISLALYRERQLWYAPVSASLPILASYLVWSRHRLSFINRFLESERAKLHSVMPRRSSRENIRLVEFFEHAVRHLPIDGWRFEAAGDRFCGGMPIAELPRERHADDWIEWQGLHARRFPTSGRLRVALSIRQPALAAEILAYIDSLARIRSRAPASATSSSIERLQHNAALLSDELGWLRGVKTFSETVLAGSPVGFAVWNPAGELVRGNALVRELLPALPVHPQLVDFLRVLGQDLSAPAGRAHLDGLLFRDEPWQITYTAGEQELVIDLSAMGRRLAERLICASIVDVSEIRSVERARAEMVEYLSHDLRSPLISALYEVEAARPDADAGPGLASEEARTRIAANVRKSLAMMDDLLHVARADNLAATDFSEVLFDTVVANALDELLPQARGRDIRLLFDVTDDELWVDGDAASLERAVGNIVHNAIKYSSPGSNVHIVLASDKPEGNGPDSNGPDSNGPDRAGEDRDAPAGDRSPGWLALTVRDQGVGIDPTAIDGLFQRFRRDPATARSHAGTGLGLALVSRVVTQHGGHVMAESGEDGTAIILRLPLLPDPDPGPDSGATTEVVG